jgi:L-asparagine oxygenase
VVPVEGLLQGMDVETLAVLASPRFVVRRPASFGHQKETHSLPLIVRGSQGQWLCRFDTENTYASDVHSQQALEALKSRLATNQFDLRLLLLPGDFLIFKNQQVLHARDAFMPLDDGADRWLLRLFGMDDLSRTIPSSTGRSFEVAA